MDRTLEEVAKEYMRTLTMNSKLELTMDQKDQVILTIRTELDIARSFYISGNAIVARTVEFHKPPTQVAGVSGFDSHRGMGSR